MAHTYTIKNLVWSVTSPIYRTRSYTKHQGNAKQAGISRDGLLVAFHCLCLPRINPAPCQRCLLLARLYLPHPLPFACSIMQPSYVFLVVLLLLLEFLDKTATYCESDKSLHQILTNLFFLQHARP